MKGRIPDAVKHRFTEMLESPSGFAKFKRIMAAVKKEDVYLKYFIEAMDRVYGKSNQTMEMEVSGISSVHNDLLEQLANGSNGSTNGQGHSGLETRE